jgi:hypothetical protein
VGLCTRFTGISDIVTHIPYPNPSPEGEGLSLRALRKAYAKLANAGEGFHPTKG